MISEERFCKCQYSSTKTSTTNCLLVFYVIISGRCLFTILSAHLSLVAFHLVIGRSRINLRSSRTGGILFALLASNSKHPIRYLTPTLFHHVGDGSQIVRIYFCKQRNSLSFSTSTTTASDPMNISNPRSWKVIVNDHVHGTEINSPSHQISAY